MQDIYSIPIQTIKGEMTTLAPYQGKILLIVNVASRCGFTPQYKTLEAFYQKNQANVAVLGFPCDQFKHQEPGSNEEIHTFAKECFRVTFPLFAKLDVKGERQSPLYQYIQKNIKKKPWFFIPWNFTKILVDANGQVLRQFWPITSLNTIQKEIDKILNK